MKDSNILSPGTELITPAHDRFLDGYPTRREMQAAFNKMGRNDAELFSMVDTQALVGNFLCERLGITREDIEAYVQKKLSEVQALNQAHTQTPAESENVQPNS